MKDLHISAKRQKSELKWLAGCFSVAFLLNILSIIMYKTLWSEIFTQLLWVLIITCALYAVSVFLRLTFYFIKKLF
jgi:hypothetical protein